ncbi:MAG: hypothetical protein MR280_01215 [Clostridium sp.]|nr:hypothetical protein [Clostridium sp.]
MNNHIFSLNCDYTNNIITISSVDDYSCKIVDSIINCFFDNNAKLYYASGLPDNIDEIYKDIKQFNPYYNAGDSKKFYIRRYPQICADLSEEKILSDLVNDWTSIIYETRKIIILTKKQKQDLLSDFINGINFQSKSDRYFRERSVCVIENAPEAENDNTFILKSDKEHIKELNDFITYRTEDDSLFCKSKPN